MDRIDSTGGRTYLLCSTEEMQILIKALDKYERSLTASLAYDWDLRMTKEEFEELERIKRNTSKLRYRLRDRLAS